MSQDTKGTIVIVDDDAEMREMLTDFFNSTGYRAFNFPLAKDAFEAFFKNELPVGSLDDVDLVITDLAMPEMDGLEFTARVKKIAPELPVILITAFGSIESAIEATKQGAYDYIVKPFKLNELSVTVDRAINFRRLQKENQLLRTEVKKGWSFGKIIGKSKAMASVFDLIDRVSQATANVLITGESGTGKEIVARAIHEKGLRAAKPFVAINCTAIPENLLESELFGHAKGSFTGAITKKKGLFEEADGGTIFLDEIGDMDLALQAKLLRVIQERKIKPVGETQTKDIDVRIIAATHKDLKRAIKEGRFREDLYYRLSVIPIVLPPLRHRKEDIPLLAEHFLQKYAAANFSKVKGFTSEAMDKIMSARWDGNVRELENIVERLVVLCNKPRIEAEDIPTMENESVDEFFSRAVSDWPTLDQLEKRYIRVVLEKTGGRKEKASQILGVNRRTLYRKEQEGDLEPIKS